MFVVAKQVMDQDATWYGGMGLGPGHTVLGGVPAPPKMGTVPTFRLMSIVAKWLDGSRCYLARR